MTFNKILGDSTHTFRYDTDVRINQLKLAKSAKFLVTFCFNFKKFLCRNGPPQKLNFYLDEMLLNDKMMIIYSQLSSALLNDA